MPTKTYYKPNRTRPRYFRMCDAARIAREVVRDNPGDTPEEVLACIAKGLGFTHISLSRPRVVEAALFPVPIPGWPMIIEAIIVVLIRLRKYAWLLPIIKNLIELVEAVKKAVDDFFTKSPPSAKCEDVFGEKCKCKKETVTGIKLIGRE